MVDKYGTAEYVPNGVSADEYALKLIADCEVKQRHQWGKGAKNAKAYHGMKLDSSSAKYNRLKG